MELTHVITTRQTPPPGMHISQHFWKRFRAILDAVVGQFWERFRPNFGAVSVHFWERFPPNSDAVCGNKLIPFAIPRIHISIENQYKMNILGAIFGTTFRSLWGHGFNQFGSPLRSFLGHGIGTFGAPIRKFLGHRFWFFRFICRANFVQFMNHLMSLRGPP